MPKQYFIDKNSFENEREVFISPFMHGTVKMTKSSTPTVVDFKGFGVAITGSSCYLLNKMGEQERQAFLRDIYIDKGVSVGRLTIASSDYSAELYSYCDEKGLENFSIKRDEEYIIPMIKEILSIKPDLYLFASPWSPPGWMKTGGQLCGGYMRMEYVEDFAEYVIKYLLAYKKHGINISAITPQNEPEAGQLGKMPACVWHPDIEKEYIKVLNKKLKENNLDVKIWMYDHNFSGIDRVMWSLEQQQLYSDISGVAFHYYDGCIEHTTCITEKYPELELHFTEGGPRLFDHYDSDWCKWGIMLSKALKCGYKSFTGWNLLLDETGNPNIGPFTCGGLVTRNSISGEMSFSGQYKVFSHIAKHINNKSKIYPFVTKEVEKNLMHAFPNTQGFVEGFLIENINETVVVLINAEDSKKQVQVDIDGTLYYVELAADSLSKIIL